jgi:hypothetical protein
MFHCEEHRVQDDAQSDEQVKQWITHHLVQSALEPQPAIIVHAALGAFITVPVWQVI